MELMLAETGSEKDLDNPMMAAELKADGTHVRVTKKGNVVRVFGRPKKTGLPEYTERLPDLTEAIQHIPGDFQIVGEAVVYDENGRTWFEGSQRRCSTQDKAKIAVYEAKYPIMLLTFDVIELDGKDLTGHTYTSRKNILFDLLKDTAQSKVIALPHVVENKREFYQTLIEQGEEGVILKRLNSTYEHTRSTNWLKVKKWDSERVKVVGYTQGTGSRETTFGSLIIAKVEDDGSLKYRGKVGTGFSAAEVRSIFKILKENQIEKQPVISGEDYTPVDVPLEVTVKFFEVTKNGVIRFPSMLKDAQGRNMIHHESTIFGTPQQGVKQTSLSALFASMKKE